MMELDHRMDEQDTTTSSFEEHSDDVEMVKQEDTHISYLWTAKLKSRNSFLTILEFLPLTRTQLHNTVRSLKEAGSTKFFERYIHPSYQFENHDLQPTTLLAFRRINPRTLGSFIPPLE